MKKKKILILSTITLLLFSCGKGSEISPNQAQSILNSIKSETENFVSPTIYTLDYFIDYQANEGTDLMERHISRHVSYNGEKHFIYIDYLSSDETETKIEMWAYLENTSLISKIIYNDENESEVDEYDNMDHAIAAFDNVVDNFFAFSFPQSTIDYQKQAIDLCEENINNFIDIDGYFAENLFDENSEFIADFRSKYNDHLYTEFILNAKGRVFNEPTLKRESQSTMLIEFDNYLLENYVLETKFVTNEYDGETLINSDEIYSNIQLNIDYNTASFRKPNID